MNKLSLVNLIGSGATGFLQIINLALCNAGIRNHNRNFAVVGGLLFLLLWFTNFAGVIVSLATGLQNKKDWKSWVSLSLHAAQFGFSSLLFLLGLMASGGSHHDTIN